jgi:hypothetical protein
MAYGFINGRLYADQETINREGPGELLKYNIQTANCQVFLSEGSPEGLILANKSSIAHDVSGGAIYVKTTTDALATGWELLMTATSSLTDEERAAITFEKALENNDLLKLIHKELIKLNKHMEILTDEELDDPVT